MKYIIKEQMVCYVAFYREIEANSPETALKLDNDGQSDYLGMSVGDAVGFMDQGPPEIVSSLPEHGYFHESA